MKRSTLTDRENAFVAARLRGLGVREAYEAAYSTAGMKKQTAAVKASSVEHRPRVAAALAAHKAAALEAAQVNMQWVLAEWVQLVRADPSELARIVRDACRHCWGFDHRYQWRDENEWAGECARALELGKPAPDLAGGYGFRRTRGPRPECPHCEGEGIERVQLADLRNVSPAARRLFAGVERTKSGFKIHTRSQDAALTNIAKALGGLAEHVKHSGAVGVVTTDAATLTPEQRARVVKALRGLL